MLLKTKFLRTYSTDPYENLAVEQILTERAQAGEILLYLWQNERTVVIGRNQNAWKECRVEELKKDGGHLARRLTGGGAVFHDLGNLNFSFCVRKEDYNVDRQLEVILRAVRYFGSKAEKTGRNDLVIDGRKFSGNAFLKTEQGCCHHGTLMLSVDEELLGRYLNVSAAKLASHGVDSVRSRTYNLQLPVEDLCLALRRAFEEVYECPAETVGPPEEALVKEKASALSSWEWLYGRKIPFTVHAEKRFAWGGAEIQLSVNEGRIKDAAFYTDALDPTLAEHVERSLIGCRYRTEDLRRSLSWNQELLKWVLTL